MANHRIVIICGRSMIETAIWLAEAVLVVEDKGVIAGHEPLDEELRRLDLIAVCSASATVSGSMASVIAEDFVDHLDGATVDCGWSCGTPFSG